jgi:single-stranded DNA-specific DHH superfamily exonuclease
MDTKTYTNMLEQVADVDNISYIVDRLICACIKLGKFDALRYEELKKEKPDADKLAVISEKSKCANEERHAICNALDAKIKLCVELGEYKFRRDVRTFDTRR